MVKLASTFSRLNPFKVLVIGDLLLDTYTIGKVLRISPEAPVTVLHVQKEEDRPGGSGNVILNLISLGAKVISIGRIGKDWAGQVILESLNKEGVDTRLIVVQEGYRTPMKNRVMADNQQIVRIDHEQILPLSEPLEQFLIESLPIILCEVQAVAISDYGKGFLTQTLLSAITKQAQKLGILVVTDPKGQDFSKYEGTTVIKPNLTEAYVAAALPLQAPLEIVAKSILITTKAQMLMITRSEAGISLFDWEGRYDFPVRVRQVKDVTGAGDTVLAMLTCALANQLSYAEAAQLCNIAAGMAIEQVGCARMTLSDLAYRFLEMDVSNKVFDEEHLFALQEVLKRRQFIVLTLSGKEKFTHDLFRAIKQLTQSSLSLLVYLREGEPEDPLIEMLASLKEVSFILIHQASFPLLLEKVTPVESYLFEEGKLHRKLHDSQLFDSLLKS
jgi:D-beta-D-heptose 7-phosphate kinase/D-beta-D-heptose 1-phosphate adenosyltransferase